MKKGISFYFGYNTNIHSRGKMIKAAGFDCVMANQDPRLNVHNGNFETQIKIFKKNNLEGSSLHNQYKTEELENFWLDNDVGKRLEETLKLDILAAQKYGFKCVVVHMMGNFSEFGKLRLLRILDLCEECNVFLAVENIDYKQPFKDIFDNISHPYLKFCYDSGHNNCFDPEIDYLSLYGDKLVCLHLHDNNGKSDEHTLNEYGTINWQEIARKLAKLDTDNLSLDYEMLFYSDIEIELSDMECLKEIYKQACELESMILEYKKLSQSNI